MPLPVPFLETQALGWLGGAGGGAGAYTHGLKRRRLLSDICSRCVSWDALVTVFRRGVLVATFSFKLLEFRDTEEFDSELHVDCSKFGIVTFIFASVFLGFAALFS